MTVEWESMREWIAEWEAIANAAIWKSVTLRRGIWGSFGQLHGALMHSQTDNEFIDRRGIDTWTAASSSHRGDNSNNKKA